MQKRNYQIEHRDDCIAVSFFSMASPCEVLFDSKDRTRIDELALWLTQETWRIEDKYSRYKSDSFLSKINASAGRAISIDEETFRLLSFADVCFDISEGRFDITSGVLRKVWTFDGSDNVPSARAVEQVMPNVGWHQIQFDERQVTLPEGMQLDLGGIGKEYAVDTIAQGLLASMKKASVDIPFLVNFGGDIFASAARLNGQPWVVGIDLKGVSETSQKVLEITQGGIATSGDANRFLLKDNKRYSHILNAKTGWPVIDAPRSITVAAPTCIQAGMLCTIAMTMGAQAETFLRDNQVTFWLY